MSRIYGTQTDLTISLATSKDLTGATSLKIVFRTPQGNSGEWNATIQDATSGIIKYDIVSPLTEVGVWRIWAKVINSSGKLMIGEPTHFTVYNEGQ
jgi:hypothetical protein